MGRAGKTNPARDGMRKRGAPPRIPQEVREKVKSLASVGSQLWIAEQCGVSQGLVSRILRELPPDQLEKDKPVERDTIEEFAAYRKERFLELQARFLKWLGDTGPKPKPPTKKSHALKKNAVINDLHVPFHHERALAQFLKENTDAEECWIAGDLFDLWSFSRYPKARQDFTPVEEFQQGRAVLRELASRFRRVRVMSGNHDDRWLKYLVAHNVPPDVLEFMRVVWPFADSPLAKLCSDFENVEMMKPAEVDFAKYPYIYQIGDCVLSHAEKFSKLDMKATAEVAAWLKSYAEPMGIVKAPRLLVQAHTHNAGKAWFGYEPRIVGIEAGCMAKTPDYAGDAKLRGANKAPVIGYTVVYQQDGVSDINKSNFIQLA